METPDVTCKRIAKLLSEELPEAPYWIQPYLLPLSGVMLVGGLTKIGKSFVLMEMARALALGKSPFGCSSLQASQCRVLLVECEVGERSLKQRFSGILKKDNIQEIEDHLWYVSKDPYLILNEERGQDRLRAYLEQIKPQVLILDPIGKLHTLDENSNSCIAELFNIIDRLVDMGRKECGLSVIFSHHFGKPARGNFLEAQDPLDIYNFRGASKWVDNPDTVVTLSDCGPLSTEHKAWRLRSRWITRHGPEIPDMYLTVNKENRGEVLFEAFHGEVKRKKLEGLEKKKIFD
jgi:hypothetical protein